MWCVLGVHNRLIGFPLFLMGKLDSAYEDFSFELHPGTDYLRNLRFYSIYTHTVVPRDTKLPTLQIFDL